MNTQAAPPQLGQNILVVMDDSPGFLDTLRVLTLKLSRVNHKFFTLLCCCPTHYWETSGEDSPELKQFMAEVWKEEERKFSRADQYLAQARAILQNAGVPSDYIQIRIATEDNLVDAVMAEIRRCQYSGIVVNHVHSGLINRLQRRGITDVFRQIPKVEVLAIHPA